MLSTHSATNSPAAMHESMMNGSSNNDQQSSTSSSSSSAQQQQQLPNIAINSRLSPRKRNMFHLRRHMKEIKYTRDMEIRMYHLFKQYTPFPPKSQPDNDQAYQISKEMLIHRATIILLDKTTRFGRNPEVVDVVLHSDQQGQMVSRLHAEITAEPDSEDPTKFSRYSIADKSLNGTYVNDRRAPTVLGELYLKKGDVIKFGHVNGASYKPGEYAIGNESEFIFTFEPAFDSMEYIGHTTDGNRIERKGPQAYIHLGAHSLLPHEFDLFSLVPKREADLSVIPYGTRINPEQKRVEYIQPHAQLTISKASETKQQHNSDPSTVPPGAFGSASIPIPGVSNSAIIPSMANFNLLSDLARISSEIHQPQSALNNNDILLNALSQYLKSSSAHSTLPPSTELLCLLQLLQPSQQHQQLPYFPQPIAPTNAIQNFNIALQQNLLRSYLQPPSSDSMITALRQITTPYLNGHTSMHNVNGINSGSGASVAQALNAAYQPSAAEMIYNATAMAAAAASIAPPTITTSCSTSSNPHLFTPSDPRPILDNHHHHHKRPNQQNQQHHHHQIIPSPDNIASASSTTSEETITTSSGRNAVADLLYNDSIISVKSEMKTVEKISINEKMIADVAKAAAAAAVGAHYRSSGETSFEAKPNVTPKIGIQQHQNTPPLSSTGSTKKPRKSKANKDDHIQETIDFVAKNSNETPTGSDLIIETFNESTGKQSHPQNQQQPPRKRKKRLSENENGKSKEKVLKILDEVAKMDSSSSSEKPLQQSTFKIEIRDSSEATTAATEQETPHPMAVDREQSSSGGSLIMCEATPDDPGLLNGSNVDLLETKKPEELKLLNRRLSSGSKVGNKGRKKKLQETESEESDEDDGDILSKYKQESRKQQHSNGSASSDTRPRKKSTSVKSRVIRVPRSPIPTYKKGPERLPGHKSNELARLMYDLEGSYMHVARKGETKRERNNTGRNDSDDETDEENSESRPSSSHVIPTKRKSIERFSKSPTKQHQRAKDSQERENDSEHEKVVVILARDTSEEEDDDEEEEKQLASPIPKMNGTSESSRKAVKRGKDSETKPKQRKNASKKMKKVSNEIEEVDEEEDDDEKHSRKSDSNSDSDDEEPTPKKRRGGGRSKKDATTKSTPQSMQKKKPGRQPKHLQHQPPMPKKKPGRKAKDKNTFVEITNNEWERCAFSGCRHPKVDTTVNWFECNGCLKWYHPECVGTTFSIVQQADEYFCPDCDDKECQAPTPTAVMA